MKITKSNVKKIYADLDPRIISYMEYIVEQLSEQYNGDIPQYLNITLDIFVHNFKIYFSALDEFKQNDYSISYENKYGAKFTVPYVKVMYTAFREITNLAKECGLTIFSSSKLKVLKEASKETKIESDQEMLESLIND